MSHCDCAGCLMTTSLIEQAIKCVVANSTSKLIELINARGKSKQAISIPTNTRKRLEGAAKVCLCVSCHALQSCYHECRDVRGLCLASYSMCCSEPELGFSPQSKLQRYQFALRTMKRSKRRLSDRVTKWWMPYLL